MADPLTDRILDSARSRLPGAMDNQIYFELADVLEDFLQRSTCWREVIPVTVVDGTFDYEISFDDIDSQITSLLWVRDINDSNVWATYLSPGLLRFRDGITPGVYNAWVVLNVAGKNVSKKYPEFPQWVADRYAGVIADGVVGRMAAMPAKPFSSINHAAFYSKKFVEGASSARIETMRQNLIGGQAWRYPRFAAQR